MRWTCWLTIVCAFAFVACGNGSANDAGPTDTATDTGGGTDAATDGLTCAEYARACQGPTPAYALCCTPTCPTGFSCGYANPGVDAGALTTVQMCTQQCQHLADCPAAGSTPALCVLGLCYQTCDPTTGGACPPAETCVTVFGRSVCAAVTCN